MAAARQNEMNDSMTDVATTTFVARPLTACGGTSVGMVRLKWDGLGSGDAFSASVFGDSAPSGGRINCLDKASLRTTA